MKTNHSLPTPAVDYETLLRALRQTVEVLARTKRSFRSRELAECRRRLEQLLEQATGAPVKLPPDITQALTVLTDGESAHRQSQLPAAFPGRTLGLSVEGTFETSSGRCPD